MQQPPYHRRTHWPRWVIPVYIVLLALAVPWYVPFGQIEPIVLGVPFWALISFGVSVFIAFLTAYLALFHWPEESSGDDHGV